MKINESKLHSTLQINLTITSKKARHKVHTHLYVQKQANIKCNISTKVHIWMIQVKEKQESDYHTSGQGVL